MRLPSESELAAGYALLLTAIAGGLEWTARRVHRRAETMRTAGFVYHAELDRWRCPAGQHLHRAASEHIDLRVYQATATTCNHCALKPACTDSDSGRTLEIQPGAWVGSTTARFHRGLSVALLLLAELILAVACWQSSSLALGLMLLALGIAGGSLAADFFRASRLRSPEL